MPLTCECPGFDGADSNWYEDEVMDYVYNGAAGDDNCSSCYAAMRPGEVGSNRSKMGYEEDLDWSGDSEFGKEMFIEDVWLCNWCSNVYESLSELGFCVGPEEDVRSLLVSYQDEYGTLEAYKATTKMLDKRFGRGWYQFAGPYRGTQR